MTKKISFLPALYSKGYLMDTNSIEIGVDFVQHRDKQKLSFPDKCINLNSPKNSMGCTWKYQNVNGNVFRRDAKQDIDVIDGDLRKYYLSRERGIEKPQHFYSRRDTFNVEQNSSLKEELKKLNNTVTDQVRNNRN
jgi:hypothetical protein